HNRQVDELARLLERDWRRQGPLIYAGDFNTRNAPDRFDYKDDRTPGELSHRYCHFNRQRCDVRKSWDSDEPWMDTPDLQGFADGNGVHIEPIRIAAMFDYPIEGRMLSDHDALSVTYRISWRATEGVRSTTQTFE
ncbi:MAG: metal-dependent hydrolase, partial [Sphingorhabdus sp.]